MKKILTALIILTAFIYSCSEENYNIRPKGQPSIETLQNKIGVDKLLIGCYAAADGTISTSTALAWAGSISNWVWGSVASDDARKGSSIGDQADINPIEQFWCPAENSYVLSHWRTWYDAVVRCNDLLGILPKANDMTDAEKILVEAQTKFLRAHAYFQLTIVHGPVPYIDENTVNPGEVPNDHRVYPEMESDMKFAVANLPGRWADKGRITKYAAETYLARIYLFQQKFAEAMPLLRDVYENGGYSLMPSYEQNYRIANLNNKESIWEIEYAVNDGISSSPNAGLGDGLCFPTGGAGLGGAVGAFFQPTHNLVSAFRVDEVTGLPLLDDTYSVDDVLTWDRTGKTVPYTKPVDPRLDHTAGRPGIPFLDWGIHQGDKWNNPTNMGPYNWKKNMFLKSEKAFQTTTGWMTGMNANNYRVYRLAHVILWLAECEAEIGSLETATNLVNEIRNRAKNSNVVRFDDGTPGLWNGTPAANYKVEPYPVTFPSKEYARKAIRTEMRLEFAMEGMRFFDLVRWGIAAEVMNNYLEVEGSFMPPLNGWHFTAGQHEIWPIPRTQIDLSLKNGVPVLVQNPGY